MMIRYALRCSEGHEFDSWFASAAAFDSLSAAGRVECVVCGCTRVEKALMAPQVRASREDGAAGPPAPLRKPRTEIEKALAELRRKVEESSEYVGLSFAAEARRMHAGETPERAIYGEARLDEARELLDEGIPVAPLPFLPQRQTN